MRRGARSGRYHLRRTAPGAGLDGVRPFDDGAGSAPALDGDPPAAGRTGRTATSWALRLLGGAALLALTAAELVVVAVVVGLMAGQARTFSAAVGWSGRPGVFVVATCATRGTGRDRTRTCTGLFRPDPAGSGIDVGRMDTDRYVPGAPLAARIYAGGRVTRPGARAALGAAGPFLLGLAGLIAALVITSTWLLPASVRFRIRAEWGEHPRLSGWAGRVWIGLLVAGFGCLLVGALGA